VVYIRLLIDSRDRDIKSSKTFEPVLGTWSIHPSIALCTAVMAATREIMVASIKRFDPESYPRPVP
jgi:hypothetical protein